MGHSFRSDIPTGPFASDPRWRDWWWWLGLPLVLAVFLISLFRLDRELYLKLVHPEGYGLLELSHFFIPLTAFVLALAMLFDPWVRSRPFVLGWLMILGLGCAYIAGEEQSWGQHFFYWSTPPSWSEINTQNETNLHNASDLFGKIPRTILELSIVIAGLILPLASRMRPERRGLHIGFYLPANALMPTAFFVLAFKLSSMAYNSQLIPIYATRASEVTETFIYLFILFYLIVLRRRILERRMPDAKATAM